MAAWHAACYHPRRRVLPWTPDFLAMRLGLWLAVIEALVSVILIIHVISSRSLNSERCMAKKSKKKQQVAWTKALHAELRRHSKARTPVAKISKLMKRTVGALRQQALKLGIGLGHQR